MKNFIKFMHATGIRSGEIIALQWDDIAFDHKIVKIYKTSIRNKEGDIKTLPLQEKLIYYHWQKTHSKGSKKLQETIKEDDEKRLKKIEKMGTILGTVIIQHL